MDDREREKWQITLRKSVKHERSDNISISILREEEMLLFRLPFYTHTYTRTHARTHRRLYHANMELVERLYLGFRPPPQPPQPRLPCGSRPVRRQQDAELKGCEPHNQHLGCRITWGRGGGGHRAAPRAPQGRSISRWFIGRSPIRSFCTSRFRDGGEASVLLLNKRKNKSTESLFLKNSCSSLIYNRLLFYLQRLFCDSCRFSVRFF